MWKNQLLDELKKDLAKSKARNSRYSMRAYAKKNGIGYGAMSELLSGKRLITESMAKKILKFINLEVSRKSYFTEQIEKSRKKEVKLLPSQAHKVIEQWEYFAVVNLMEIRTRLTKKEISLRLNIKENKIKRILKDLTTRSRR